MKCRTLVLFLAACITASLIFAFPAAAAQRTIKTEAERQAIRDVLEEKDPHARLGKAEAFLRSFPDSQLLDIVYIQISFAHHDLGETALALKAGHKAVEINSNSIHGFFTLGVGYLNAEPRNYELGIWCLARGVALARASKDGPDTKMEKNFREIYIGYAGSEDGLSDVIQRAGEIAWPPDGFHLPDPPLYGEDKVSPGAVLQGGLGSCFFHSPIAALARSNPKRIPPMINDNGDRTYTVTFADKKQEKAYLEDMRYARSSGFDRSTGLWVGVLFRAYAQRVLREALVASVDKSDLFPLLKPYARDFLSTSDLLLLAYDRAIRAVVSQSAEIDRAKLEAQLQEEVKPLPISEEVKTAGLKLINSSGVFESIEALVKEDSELFGAYRAVGRGGHPARVLAAFLGGKPLALATKDPAQAVEALSDIIAEGLPVVAGTSPTPLENLNTSSPLPADAPEWYVPAHAYTVLDVDPTTSKVTLRNPWGNRPDPDGVFSIPVETFLETFPLVATIADKK